MTKRSIHASGFWSITTEDDVVATTIGPLDFVFFISSTFHRAPIWTHRYRQLPALGSCYGGVVFRKTNTVNK